jgi:uncharacterized protein YrrD
MGLLRGADLVGVPVVTLGGDDVAEVRDVLFDATQGTLLGFTLNKRGRLRGRLSKSLEQNDVLAIGPNAIIIGSASALSDKAESQEADGGALKGQGGNVLSDRVLTDSGVDIGIVTDVVIDSAAAAVVGFEIQPVDEHKSRNGRKSYIPFHDTRSLSSETLVVPAAAIDYIASDFAGFAEAVDRYRDALAASRDPQ